jgi:predicted alpha/beta superfamily hydrolase
LPAATATATAVSPSPYHYQQSAIRHLRHFRPRPHEMTQSTKLWITKLANKLGCSEEQRRTKKNKEEQRRTKKKNKEGE